MVGFLAAPSRAWSAAPASPPPPPPPSSGSGTAPGQGEPTGPLAPGARQTPGARPGPGATPPAPKNPASPTSPPPPPRGGGTAPAEPAEPPAQPVDLSDTWGYSKSRPLAPRYTRPEDDDAGFTPANPSGFYSGVSTQGNHVPPIPPDDFNGRPVLMTWTGFERAPEGSRVYFQLNGPVAHEMQQDGLVLKVRMRNTKVNVKNNARRLDMRYFETPVREVRVRRVGKDTEATIELKRAAHADVALVDGKAGYKLLTVQFDDARPGGSGSGGAGDPYRSAGGGGYVGGDTTEPQRTGRAAGTGDAGPAAAGAAGAAGQGIGPDAATASGQGAPAREGWFPLDLYVVSHD